MAHKELAVALGMIIASAPLSATKPEPEVTASVPEAGPNARYCLRVEPVTGSRIESVKCRTREQWVQLGVDLDAEWPKEGVGIRS